MELIEVTIMQHVTPSRYTLGDAFAGR